MVITTPMENTLIPNTTMCEKYIDGILKGYSITANEGYVLHDKALDWENVDGLTGEILSSGPGYTRATVTCGSTYNFTTNPREFYAVLESEVPADSIFGETNPPEIM